MKVTCNECGKKYQIDTTKIAGVERSFVCRGCQNLITVQKPENDFVEEMALPAEEQFFDEKPAAVENEAMPEYDDDPLAELDALAAAGGTSDFLGDDLDMKAASAAEESFADLDAELDGDDATADFILSDLNEDGDQDVMSLEDETSDDLLDASSATASAAAMEDDSASSEGAGEEAAEETSATKSDIGFWQGLTGKVVIAMLLVGVIPLAGFGVVSYMLTNKSLNQSASKVIERTADGLKTQVEEWVDKNLKVLQAVATLPDVVSMDPDAQETVLRSVTRAYPWIYLGFTLDIDGINLARSDDNQPVSYSHRRYYWEIVDGKEFAWQTLVEDGEPALILAVPIREEGELVGVVAASMKIDDIAQWIATWKEGETGYAALIEKDGKVIVHPNKDMYDLQYNLVGGGHPLAVNFREGKLGNASFVNAEGNQAFGTITSTRHGWGLMIEQESDEVFAVTRQLEPLFIAGLVVAALLAALFGLIFARGIVRPVLSLSDAADRLSLGELDVTIDVNSKDEIGQLAKSITRMQDSLRIALEWLRSMK